MAGGLTLPNPFVKDGAFILAANESEFHLQHESGHAEQIRELGNLGYMKEIGISSSYNAVENAFETMMYGKEIFSISHEEYYTEVDVNIKVFWLYGGDFKHQERNDKKELVPSNPLIGRVTNLSALERIQLYYLTLHH